VPAPVAQPAGRSVEERAALAADVAAALDRIFGRT
jgi:hypothetical protein